MRKVADLPNWAVRPFGFCKLSLVIFIITTMYGKYSVFFHVKQVQNAVNILSVVVFGEFFLRADHLARINRFLLEMGFMVGSFADALVP
ncbi:hypothetical protein CR164_10065 [Prosthecochloris marina]|uniref:Uncharacterized protein n=1 Tax=Prosthecochloris marina TaxID=2017681 RepID=A0A317T412_9CHLB|nr:hypothetical protein CR164_10065 [Prosthecochloris marina]